MNLSQGLQNGKILIVDDQLANVQLLERMLLGAGYTNVSSTTYPSEVCRLHAQHRYHLILLDLNMPGMDGFQVMEGLKRIEADAYLPVLVITAQSELKLLALRTGAKDFISKPFDMVEVLARVHNMLEVRMLHQSLSDFNANLERLVRERTSDLQNGYEETIFTMTRAAEHKDEDTGSHVRRISHYCRMLARDMGLNAEFVDQIYIASPMHDVGKIGIPDHILLKPGGFFPEEWEVMKTHAAMGAEILGRSKSPYLQMGAQIALDHHERWDGSGYPQGKRGDEISLAARIMSICDIYDALRSVRPYKLAMAHQRAVDIINQGDGRTHPGHFDPQVLAAFARNHLAFEQIFQTLTE